MPMIFSTRRFQRLLPALSRAALPRYSSYVLFLLTGWCASSRCGMSSPSRKSAVPAPVPSVSTNSMPFPSIAASPCISASLIMRTGRCPRCSASMSASGTLRQNSLPRFGAVSTWLSRTTPGKPIEICVAGSGVNSGPTSSTSFCTITSGGHGCGVATLTRSVSIFPWASIIAAFRPVPPTSMARIRSFALERLVVLPVAVLTAVVLLAAVFFTAALRAAVPILFSSVLVVVIGFLRVFVRQRAPGAAVGLQQLVGFLRSRTARSVAMYRQRPAFRMQHTVNRFPACFNAVCALEQRLVAEHTVVQQRFVTHVRLLVEEIAIFERRLDGPDLHH